MLIVGTGISNPLIDAFFIWALPLTFWQSFNVCRNGYSLCLDKSNKALFLTTLFPLEKYPGCIHPGDNHDWPKQGTKHYPKNATS